MNHENYIEYIRRGLSILVKEDKKSYRKSAIKLLFCNLIIMLGVWGVGGVFAKLGGIVLMVKVLSTILVFVLSAKPLNSAKRLVISLVTTLDLILLLFVFEFLAYFSVYDNYTCIIMINMTIIIVPILVGIRNSIMLRKHDFCYKDKAEAQKVTAPYIPGFIHMLAVIPIYLYFEFIGYTNESIANMVVFVFGILNTVCSIYFLNAQRLYYLIKLKKQGLITEEDLIFHDEEEH